MNTDSIEYLESFVKVLNERKYVVISPSFFRDFEGCLDSSGEGSKCSGCCKKVDLCFLSGSKRFDDFCKMYPDKIKDFERVFVGNATFFINYQRENKGHFCMYVDHQTGLCKIHNPTTLACSLPMVKVANFQIRDTASLISQTYGRLWSFTRVTSEKGGLCKSTPYNSERTKSDISKLIELKEIVDQIGRHSTEILGKVILKLKEVVELGELPKEKIVIK